MEEEKKKNILEYFSVEAGIIVLIAVIIIGILFYLGMLPFNSNAKKTQPSAISTQTSAGSITVGCPVSDALCATSKIFKAPNTKFSTLLWTLPVDSKIFAVFDGTMKQEIMPIASDSAMYVTTITSTNGKYQANYVFASSKLDKAITKTTLPEKTVKAKEMISPVSENNTLFKDTKINMTFYVTTISTPIDITPKNVGKIVLP